MQHKERRLLMDGLLEIVSSSFGDTVVERARPDLDRKIDQLLNDFLLESQPPQATEVTILLADLRGFTAIAESYPPDIVVNILNRYFATMADLVADHGGVVDKFMGDSVMALFGAPVRRDDDLSRALCCAVRMQQAMLALNKVHEQLGQPRLYAGIGINTGRVMAGSFGSQVHNEYTVIGDQVNLAARIEAYSLRGQILMSESVRSLADAMVEVASSNRVLVKGRHEPIVLHELAAVVHPERLEVPRVEVRRSPRIEVDLPMEFRLIQDKKVLPRAFHGRMLDLSYHGMCASLPLQLDPFSEMVMTLTPELVGGTAEDLYAKVIRCHESGEGFTGSFAFTAADTPAHLAVKQYVDRALCGR